MQAGPAVAHHRIPCGHMCFHAPGTVPTLPTFSCGPVGIAKGAGPFQKFKILSAEFIFN